MQRDPTREIIDKCKRETLVRYKSKGNTFFRRRMRGINYLQVGRSHIIDSPLTVMIEWMFEQWRRLRRGWQRFTARLFPRRARLPPPPPATPPGGPLALAGGPGPRRPHPHP